MSERKFGKHDKMSERKFGKHELTREQVIDILESIKLVDAPNSYSPGLRLEYAGFGITKRYPVDEAKAMMGQEMGQYVPGSLRLVFSEEK